MKRAPKIEKGIELPARVYHHSLLAGTFSKMKPGDSFIWHNASSPLMYAKRNGFHVTSRKENGTGYRIWLVSKKKK